ncbi:glycosyltransferase family 2 protein [Nocardioides mangrovicus]|uniref:glycosyltransferase family 2 protein n=1 Tax=Nocardioides mangrovicus TaxID=2478913 RepID=UPI001314107B|nr:glycosyltransferase family A protein [Nocardioides mangrovicus]
MSRPRTSVVVPTYRGAHRLPALLDGLAAQSDDDLEVVIAVDGDVDGSAAVVEARTDLPVRAVVLPRNQGRSAALNAGFAAARGELLVRCDDDLELSPGYVAAHVAAHASARVGVIGPCRNVYDDTAYARVFGTDADQRLLQAQLSAGPETAWRFWGGNVSVTREDQERVGEYDHRTFDRYGWEDADWGYRLWRTGCPVVVDPRAWAVHHGAAISAATRAGRAFDSGWSQALFERKHDLDLDQRGAAPHSPWQRLVSRYADGLDAAEVRRRGERADDHLARWPRYLARKRVALLVEAAARSGYLSATRSATERTPTP